jgi:hypothetical protein
LVNAETPPWRVDTMAGAPGWSSSSSQLEVPTANGNDPFALVRYMQVRTSFTGGERWGRYYQVRDPDSPILKLLNVRYILSNGDLPQPGALVRRANLPGTVVWENPRPLPRFFLVGRVRRAGGMEEAVAMLRSPEFDPAAEAIVEPQQHEPLQWGRLSICPTRPTSIPRLQKVGVWSPSGPAASLPHGGTTRVLRYGARQVEIETVAEAPSFLVTSETWYPGWRASIDGREQKIVLTNVAFRGLAVPAGRHVVAMRFDPPVLWQSALVSLAAIALAALLARRDGVGDNDAQRVRWTSSSS